MYINKSDDIVSENNNTYHRIIKMKPVDVRDNTYVDYYYYYYYYYYFTFILSKLEFGFYKSHIYELFTPVSKKEVNDNDSKFKVGDHVRISKYKIFLLKDTN